jgi:hypothetical protein
MKILYPILLLVLFLTTLVAAQNEVLSNSDIVEMTKAGLPESVIITKIKGSEGRFDVSVGSLIDMKKAGVGNDVINALLQSKPAPPENRASRKSISDPAKRATPEFTGPKEALLSAKTIAIKKDSVHPSVQAVEKELMKRKEWPALDLAIGQYWDKADLYVEISFVRMSVVTHRYTFRVYDRRSGTVIAAGETTSWGSLAENLARNIAKSLNKVRVG